MDSVNFEAIKNSSFQDRIVDYATSLVDKYKLKQETVPRDYDIASFAVDSVGAEFSRLKISIPKESFSDHVEWRTSIIYVCDENPAKTYFVNVGSDNTVTKAYYDGREPEWMSRIEIENFYSELKAIEPLLTPEV